MSQPQNEDLSIQVVECSENTDAVIERSASVNTLGSMNNSNPVPEDTNTISKENNDASQLTSIGNGEPNNEKAQTKPENDELRDTVNEEEDFPDSSSISTHLSRKTSQQLKDLNVATNSPMNDVVIRLNEAEQLSIHSSENKIDIAHDEGVDIDVHDLDPRIKGSLERLNAASDRVNAIEKELESCKEYYRSVIKEGDVKLQQTLHKLGTRGALEKSKPHFIAEANVKKIQKEIGLLAIQYEKSTLALETAQKEQALQEEQVFAQLEAGAKPGTAVRLDMETQEKLNNTALRVEECIENQHKTGIEHRDAANKMVEAKKLRDTLAVSLKPYVTRSKHYFEVKHQIEEKIESTQKQLEFLQEEATRARGEVSRCLTALSDLSLDIHNSRQTSPHRSPSISQSDLHERSENDNVAVSSSNHEGQSTGAATAGGLLTVASSSGNMNRQILKNKNIDHLHVISFEDDSLDEELSGFHTSDLSKENICEASSSLVNSEDTFAQICSRSSSVHDKIEDTKADADVHVDGDTKTNVTNEFSNIKEDEIIESSAIIDSNAVNEQQHVDDGNDDSSTDDNNNDNNNNDNNNDELNNTNDDNGNNDSNDNINNTDSHDNIDNTDSHDNNIDNGSNDISENNDNNIDDKRS